MSLDPFVDHFHIKWHQSGRIGVQSNEMVAILVYQENSVGIELLYHVANFFCQRKQQDNLRPEPSLPVLYKFEILAAWPRHAFTDPLTDSGLTRWSRCSHYMTKNKATYKRIQHCWWTTPSCMLLHVVGSCFAKFETCQTFEPTTPKISFYLLIIVLWVVIILSTMHCRSNYCWELLHLFAHYCQHGHNNSKHCWPNNVGSCCIPLHTTARMDTTIPNIADWTMLGVVASLCTPLPAWTQ